MIKNKNGHRVYIPGILITAGCMVVLYFVFVSIVSAQMKYNARDNMNILLNAKTELLNQYIEDSEKKLAAFGSSGELKAFLKNQNDEGLREAAQEFTENYYSALGNWEGIYLDTWDAEVITHSNPEVPGMIMREGNSLKALQESILSAKGEVYNIGTLVSPTTNRIVMAMYYPIMEEGKALGFVGGAIFANGLVDILDTSLSDKYNNETYSLINLNTNVYIFDSNEKLNNTEINSEPVLDMVDSINEGSDTGINVYTGEDGEEYFSVYKLLEDRGWALVLTDVSSEVYSNIYQYHFIVGIVCMLLFLVITVSSFFVKNK
ncbi:MAG: hypothetical protein E7265_06220 [Lachnospiraceae bacterium]|nr:hypothetical protein [Lachnospiraceae bacterium]